MENFTAGPWVVGSESMMGDEYMCVDTGYGCEPTGLPNEVCIIMEDRQGQEWGAQAKANAQLIAAAPELLGALETAVLEMKKACTSLGWDATHLPLMEAVIKKARAE